MVYFDSGRIFIQFKTFANVIVYSAVTRGVGARGEVNIFFP